MLAGCTCVNGVMEKFDSYSNMDDQGAPGNHITYRECTRCGGAMLQNMQRHNFRRELKWACLCGAEDPTRPHLGR